MNTNKYRLDRKGKIKLSTIDTGDTGKLHSKKDGLELTAANISKMTILQDKLYAQDRYSLLIIFQAMDTAGKDGAIQHVMSGLNPQGTQVQSFKVPSKEELDHDYLWRANKNLPERGRIGIFNRSYYEEVLVVKVHDLLKTQQLPPELIGRNIWNNRYSQIRNYERYLSENGVAILKFFLHISKEEQKERLLARIDDKTKNWKFSAADIEERKYWEQYQLCYQEAMGETASKYAPWFIIPADKKWFARLLISEVIVQTMEKLNLEYPQLSGQQLEALEDCKLQLMNEA
jgi:PPK2 family polyphosphate:nucleotide phosphotransferase